MHRILLKRNLKDSLLNNLASVDRAFRATCCRGWYLLLTMWSCGNYIQISMVIFYICLQAFECYDSYLREDTFGAHRVPRPWTGFTSCSGLKAEIGSHAFNSLCTKDPRVDAYCHESCNFSSCSEPLESNVDLRGPSATSYSFSRAETNCTGYFLVWGARFLISCLNQGPLLPQRGAFFDIWVRDFASRTHS